MNKQLLILLLLAAISGCKKDSPPEKPVDKPYQPSTQGVFILNEGGYNFGNASVSYYDLKTGTVSNNIYKAANGFDLGDVCQSMTLYGGRAYIVVNNSGKTEVVNPKTFVRSGIISGLLSPRYFLPIDSTKAYVTDLYSNAISVVDLRSNKKTKEISCPGWTEGIIAYNGRAYVTNLRHSAIYVVNTQTDLIEDSIPVGFASSSIVKDRNNKIWTLCEGDNTRHIKGGLYRLDPANKQIELKLEFVDGQGPKQLHINGMLDTLYYLNNGVFQMSINAAVLPGAALVASSGRNFYGMNIDPSTGIIYVADAKDYQQISTVYRYSSQGALLNSFLTGIISNGFVFYQQ